MDYYLRFNLKQRNHVNGPLGVQIELSFLVVNEILSQWYTEYIGNTSRTELFIYINREETEIIEGEVVEIQIDRPATGTVSILFCPFFGVQHPFQDYFSFTMVTIAPINVFVNFIFQEFFSTVFTVFSHIVKQFFFTVSGK